MVKVAVIDNGIDTKFVAKEKIIKQILWKEEIRINVPEDYHGTVCAKIIEGICADIMIYDLVIMQNTASIDDLVSSLMWCYYNDIKVINLSLGTLNYFDGMKLKKIVSKLIQKGCFIVAAYHNCNIKSFPAIYPGVFGVCHAEGNELKDGEFFIQPGNKNLYIACMRDISLGNGIYLRYMNANSFAAPVITGHIALYLSQFPDATILDVIKYLELKQKSSINERIIIQNQMEILEYKQIFCKCIILDTRISFNINKFSRAVNECGKCAIIIDYNLSVDKCIPFSWYSDEKKIDKKLIYTLYKIYKADFFIFRGERVECDLNLFNSEVDAIIFYEHNNQQIIIGEKKYVDLEEEDIFNLIMEI